MLKERPKTFLLLGLMLVAAGAAYAMRPTQKIADLAPPVDLKKITPSAFGTWKADPEGTIQVINPQQETVLKQIYTQTLQRTYVNALGDRIMLSIAYGVDQRREMATHFPEVCYPTQGFNVIRTKDEELDIGQGKIPIRHLETVFGGARYEPVTYWMTIGDAVTIASTDRRLVELRYGLQRKIPDGLLYRVSSISRDAPRAFNVHATFIRDFVAALSPSERALFVGARRAN